MIARLTAWEDDFARRHPRAYLIAEGIATLGGFTAFIGALFVVP